ncbi:hypothetical protein HPL003_12255 [Paenibacillus terrae HPL-003]|uniref:Uncharacterized protein n=1 Tax=Paenibacillus terrae (strain HPL-003) TaxID=985665 RepID=G7W226_PAETH|nr:hypothetical protein HPL003_12255 [Paenibacillus terrae HPL-003]
MIGIYSFKSILISIRTELLFFTGLIQFRGDYSDNLIIYSLVLMEIKIRLKTNGVIFKAETEGQVKMIQCYLIEEV